MVCLSACYKVTLPNVHERLVDSQLYEPIPFQAALDDGCTHVMVIRSRPDGRRAIQVLHEYAFVNLLHFRAEVVNLGA